MLRAVAASYWTALALGIVILALQVRWYTVDKAASGEVLSGFGAALVVLGVFVGSRPYIPAGISGMINASLPDGGAGVFGGPTYDASLKAVHDKVRPEVTRDLWAERIIAVAVVILGTLLNGYGPLIARLLHLRGS